MKKKTLLNTFTLAAIFLQLAQPCNADVNVVREVVITPKGVNAAANIGSVNNSPNIRMTNAVVDIFVTTPTPADRDFLTLTVKGFFELQNQSTETLKLTMGFPVSNSQYSAFELSSFRAESDGSVREVFNRKSTYPKQLVHEYVSGEKGPDKAVPPADIDAETMKMFGEQIMGQETFQNLMVWEDDFIAGQTKKIVVNYEIDLPLQTKTVVREKVKGNYKGIWPQEANNVPVDFLASLPEGSYYFFDYYLTSGASWAGTIGSEDVRLHFGPEWQGHDLHTSGKGNFFISGGVNAGPGAQTTYYYMLRDEEPMENIYVAVPPPESGL